MMTGGIDSLLNNRMAAGRQDPQYLTNSYQKNQDLLDLLALQKLKSEKEAAKRQMLLQGGGTPPTVREQREQELVSMNKQELAQQVGGAAQQQMAQQQQAMQRMMGGVGGQQVPTMMAEGGIVGYETGGVVGYHGDGTPITEEEMARILTTHRGIDLPENIMFLNERPLDAPTEPKRITNLSEAWDKVKQSIPFRPDISGTNLERVRNRLDEMDAPLITRAVANPMAVFQDFMGTTRQIGEQIGEGVELAREGVDVALDQGRQGLDVARGEQPAADPMNEGIGAFVGPQPRPATQSQTASTPAPRAEEQPAALPKTMDRMTPQEIAMGLANNPAQYMQMAGGEATPQATPARETAGIGALADQMARLEAERGDKWGAVSDWMRGVAGAKDNSLGMSLAGGADALDTRNRDLEERLSQLVDTQQKMDLAERAMGVDERGVAAEEARVAAAQAATQIEAELTREGWDRDDARAAATEAQRMITQIATANRISPAALTDVYLSAYDTAKMNGDPDPLSAAKAAVADYTSVFRAYGGSTPLTEFVGPDGE